MKILVFQHSAVEHPGILRDFMTIDGVLWDAVDFDAGDPIPDLAQYGAMIVMGGAQQVWEEDRYPWLKAEKAAIRTFAGEMQRPFLGICLGHQLLGDALGGQVRKAPVPEVGVMTVEQTDAGLSDPLCSGLPRQIDVFQWHGAEVSAMPRGCEVLASSAACAVQSLRYGRWAYGLQFHIDVQATSVSDWTADSAGTVLEQAYGANGPARLEAEVRSSLPALNRDAGLFYRNFMSICRPSTA